MKYPALFCILLVFLILFLSHQTFPQIHTSKGREYFKQLTRVQGLVELFAYCIMQERNSLGGNLLVRSNYKLVKFRYACSRWGKAINKIPLA